MEKEEGGAVEVEEEVSSISGRKKDGGRMERMAERELATPDVRKDERLAVLDDWKGEIMAEEEGEGDRR
jgi:hypothetical protein